MSLCLPILLLQVLAQPPAAPVPAATPPSTDGWTDFVHHRDRLIFIPTVVSGIEGWALLDSGAGTTILNESFAAKMGMELAESGVALGVGGKQAFRYGEPVDLKVGNLDFSGVPSVAMDLSGFEGAFGRPVDLILGLEFFQALVVEIDYPAAKIRFHDRNAPKLEGLFSWTTMTLKDQLLMVACSLEGKPPIQASLDTGNSGVVEVFAPFVEEHGMLKGRRYSWTAGRGIGGEIKEPIASLSSIQIAGRVLTDVPVILHQQDEHAYATMPGSANIGGGFLSSFHVVFDLERKRFGILVGKIGKMPGKNRTGLHLYRFPEYLEVYFVAPGSPGEKQGWQVGERILSIDMVPVAEIQDPLAWRSGAEGAVLALEDGKGKVRFLKLEAYY